MRWRNLNFNRWGQEKFIFWKNLWRMEKLTWGPLPCDYETEIRWEIVRIRKFHGAFLYINFRNFLKSRKPLKKYDQPAEKTWMYVKIWGYHTVWSCRFMSHNWRLVPYARIPAHEVLGSCNLCLNKALHEADSLGGEFIRNSPPLYDKMTLETNMHNI